MSAAKIFAGPERTPVSVAFFEKSNLLFTSKQCLWTVRYLKVPEFDKKISWHSEQLHPKHLALNLLIHTHKPSYKNYTIDSIFAKDGHTVLRLPPYHPEFNSIKKIWAILKDRVAFKNITFKLNDVEELAKEEFGKITKDEWSHVCPHTVNIEENYIQKEHITDKLTDELIINLDDDGDSDLDFSSDDD